MLPRLRTERLAKGLTQGELSEVSGVHRDTIQKLEAGQRPARPATIKKLAAALGVGTEMLAKNQKEETMEQTMTAEKRVQVEVRWETEHGPRGENLRFRGEKVNSYEERGSNFTLYKCPDGYRVHVESDDGTASLYPIEPNTYTGEAEYPTYTAEDLLEEFPLFGGTVGVYPVRDID